MKYGIPPSICPVDHRLGKWTNEYQKRWIDKQRALEDQVVVSSQQQEQPPPPQLQHQPANQPNLDVQVGTAMPPGGQLSNHQIFQRLTSNQLVQPNPTPTFTFPLSMYTQAVYPPAGQQQQQQQQSVFGSTNLVGRPLGSGGVNAASSVATGNTTAAAVARSNTVAAKASSSRNNNKPIVDEPTSNDCLLGRGKSIDQHDCNIRFRKILSDHPLLYDYRKAPKDHKRRIAEKTLKVLHDEYNIKRFLIEHESGDGWVVANHDDVLEKISRTFRRTLKVKKTNDNNGADMD